MITLRYALLLSVLGANCVAQTPLPPEPGDPLARALARAVPLLPAGGFVAAESEHDIVHYFSAGHPAPLTGIPPERVIFEIGSVTKVFTGLLLAQAVVEHRMALGDPISRYLPASVALAPAAAAITLEELATHTSGLPRDPPNLRAKDRRDPFADYAVDDLYAFLRNYQPAAPVPAPAAYSNLGMGLLGVMLERAYHETYAELIAEKIAQPLRLADTVTALSDEQRSRLAVPHAGRFPVRPLGYRDALVGAGGLYSTAADLVRLGHVLMLDFDHPLRDAWELARQPRRDFPQMNGKIGLGVLLMEHGGATVYWHGGTTAGTRSHLEWSPADKHLLVVLLNDDSIAAMNQVVTLYQLVPPAAPRPPEKIPPPPSSSQAR
jgi:D-alanyl-D-alanine-carboxypeptidase/D-alanyl-D-alanine-endopeptidase